MSVVVRDWGLDPIDLRAKGLIVVLKPTEFHIKANGRVDDTPSLAIVMEDADGHAVVGEISLAMLEPVLVAIRARKSAGRLAAIVAAWPTIVGHEEHCEPIDVQGDGVLVVRVTNHSVSHQLAFMEPEIVSALAQFGVKSLLFRVAAKAVTA